MGSSQNGKPDLVVSVLDGLGSSDLVLFVEDGSSDDGNGVGRRTMVSSHFCVELTDGAVQGDISVLLVHVMVSGS
jgi:hypothetical protein